MAPALPLLLFSTLALMAAALWPRPGQAVLLALPAGSEAALASAFEAEAWRVRDISRRGPVFLILALPETPAADPAALRRATGAAIAWRANPPVDCRLP